MLIIFKHTLIIQNIHCVDHFGNYSNSIVDKKLDFIHVFIGTFQAEKEEVVYGLVHPLDSWGPLHSQVI